MRSVIILFVNFIYIISKRKDKIKTNYCVNNNINLLRIPYWDFENIEEIINQKIETLKTFDGQVS